MLTAATQNRPTSNCRTALRRVCLLTDGNAHHPAPCHPIYTAHHADCISEAMLPEIRTIALLIAAARHTVSRPSPRLFSDEADWLAARIMVLNIRTLHLPESQAPLLHQANERARAFARRLNLPFRPVRLRAAADVCGCLIADCALGGRACANLFENTQALRKIVFKLPKTFPNHGKLQ